MQDLIPSVAVIGDSTFTHSGMTGLLDAVNDKSNITVMILDNATTGMTGGQDSAALGKIEAICMALGVEEDHIHVINPSPKYHEENLAIMKEEINYDGVSVIIPRRECIQTVTRRISEEKKKSVTETVKHNHEKGYNFSRCRRTGNLSIAATIGTAALSAGFHLKQAEVHGMSQRGGDVQSNLRISDVRSLPTLYQWEKLI
jgi:TPP-dependent indolepyruvate ferredoxin oxidoreductase alpha subunit